MADGEKKDDLKLCGEIDKRYAKLSGVGAKVLRMAISTHTLEDEIEIIRQIVERRSQLTDDGKQFADKRLGVDAAQPQNGD